MLALNSQRDCRRLHQGSGDVIVGTLQLIRSIQSVPGFEVRVC